MGWLEILVIVALLVAIAGVSTLGSRVRPPGVPAGDDTSRRAVFERARRDWLGRKSPASDRVRRSDATDR